MIGRVISTKMLASLASGRSHAKGGRSGQKTATVLVERREIHPLYKKSFKRSKKYLVDDPIGVKMGDEVEILKVAPISKRKHFRIVKVLGKSLEEITEEKLKEQAKGVIEEAMPEEKGGSKRKEKSVERIVKNKK